MFETQTLCIVECTTQTEKQTEETPTQPNHPVVTVKTIRRSKQHQGSLHKKTSSKYHDHYDQSERPYSFREPKLFSKHSNKLVVPVATVYATKWKLQQL